MDVTSASSALITAAPVFGPLLILALAALCWVANRWIKAQDALLSEKDARLEDAKEYAAFGEAAKRVMEANTEAIKTSLDFLRDRARS